MCNRNKDKRHLRNQSKTITGTGGHRGSLKVVTGREWSLKGEKRQTTREKRAATEQKGGICRTKLVSCIVLLDS
jgi:hypothetical protein